VTPASCRWPAAASAAGRRIAASRVSRVPTGGASGLFSTAQQLGGALGVALLGTVFFGYASGHPFRAALIHMAPYPMGAFALCAVLPLLLPRSAVSEEALTEG
jgi:hypothetical protein